MSRRGPAQPCKSRPRGVTSLLCGWKTVLRTEHWLLVNAIGNAAIGMGSALAFRLITQSAAQQYGMVDQRASYL